jgi:Gram-negative bacterial TonB protein C-terminal
MTIRAVTYASWGQDQGARFGIALFASVLLHALMLLSLPEQTGPESIVVRSVRAPLRVVIENLPTRPVAVPIVVREKKLSQYNELEAASAVASRAQEEFERSTVRPDVSVSNIVFLRPIPSRINNVLLESREYFRNSDVSEVPEPVAMKVPEYPTMAAAGNISGWVLVMLFVDEHGEAVDTVAAESSESFIGFADQAAAGLRGSAYTPGRLDGRAVKTLMFATVRFEAPKLSESQVATAAHVPLIFGYKSNGQGNN